jgi:hypothetical protein
VSSTRPKRYVENMIRDRWAQNQSKTFFCLSSPVPRKNWMHMDVAVHVLPSLSLPIYRGRRWISLVLLPCGMWIHLGTAGEKKIHLDLHNLIWKELNETGWNRHALSQDQRWGKSQHHCHHPDTRRSNDSSQWLINKETITRDCQKKTTTQHQAHPCGSWTGK